MDPFPDIFYFRQPFKLLFAVITTCIICGQMKINYDNTSPQPNYHSYDHNAIKNCLEHSLQLYNKTLQLQKKTLAFWNHLVENVGPEWERFEPKLEVLETSLVDLTLDFATLKSWYIEFDIGMIPWALRGYYNSVVKKYVGVNEDFGKMSKERTDFVYLGRNTKDGINIGEFVADSDAINKILRNYRDCETTLMRSGFFFDRSEDKIPCDPERFEVNAKHLYNLYNLFVELERIEVEAMLEEETIYSFQQFASFIDDTLDRNEAVRTKIRNKCEWLEMSYMRHVNRLGDLATQVNTMWNEIRLYPLEEFRTEPYNI